MPTIALVDEDHNILTSVSIAFEMEGFRIIPYRDGASALDGFKTNLPDLAILDVKMPRTDGMEMLRRLRERSDIPVILLTSREDEIDELFGLKMGADFFIRKPFSLRILVERVKALLSRRIPKDDAAPIKAQEQPIERSQLRMGTVRHSCTWKDQPIRLILQALAKRPGVVQSPNALMDAAYDDQVYVDDRTIDSNIKRLRRRFRSADAGFDMIETLYGVRFTELWRHIAAHGFIGGASLKTGSTGRAYSARDRPPPPVDRFDQIDAGHIIGKPIFSGTCASSILVPLWRIPTISAASCR